MSSSSRIAPEDVDDVVEAALASRFHLGAAFIPQLAQRVRSTGVTDDALEACLARLGAQGRVVIADHAAPDVHLEQADLRVVAATRLPGATPDVPDAHERAQLFWQAWIRSFLMNHSCR